MLVSHVQVQRIAIHVEAIEQVLPASVPLDTMMMVYQQIVNLAFLSVRRAQLHLAAQLA